MAHWTNLLLSLALALVLPACSGDDTGGNVMIASPPANTAPTFTSAASLTVPENAQGAVYTAEASDADGDILTYSIASGGDGALFTIDATGGAVSFLQAPDFEAPADGNGDNVYELTLEVRDGDGASDTLALTLTVLDEPDTAPVRYVDFLFSQIDVQADVPFALVDGQTLTMDIYSPAGDSETQRPVILVAFGGGFVSGDKADVAGLASNFAERGYVAAAIDYRILSGQPSDGNELLEAGLAATHDLFGAVRFFREDAEGANTFGTRSDAVFAMGISAGAIMALNAAVLDTQDTITDTRVQAYFDANGGVFGDVGGRTTTASTIQGALGFSGAVFDLSTIDAVSAPVYLAHEEFDPVVPCDTDAEGSSFTGLVLSGSCDIAPAYDAAGVRADTFIVAGAVGHVNFTAAQFNEILDGAARLFLETVIDP
ncbi:MAG: cadherin domain-containing protein [Pseudomonadota bacterium]